MVRPMSADEAMTIVADVLVTYRARLRRDVGVALDHVVAIAQKLCDKGRWDFCGEALQGGVACS